MDGWMDGWTDGRTEGENITSLNKEGHDHVTKKHIFPPCAKIFLTHVAR